MNKQQGIGIVHILIFIVMVAVGAVGWKNYQHNKAAEEARAVIEKERAEIKKSMADLKGLFGKWNDAEMLAASSPRISLAAPVASLQEIKRETAAVSVAPCLAQAKEALVDGMTLRIDAYLSFMQRANLDAELKASTEQFDEFVRLAGVCKEK